MSESNEAPAAIVATTNTIKTLVDGSMRLTITIEPKDAITAFTLFGQPGIAVALAKLTPAASLASLRKDAAREPEKGPHGNAWALLFRTGVFFSPDLHALLGIRRDVEELRRGGGENAGRQITDRVTEVIRAEFGVESLSEIPPRKFRTYLQDIEHILPKEFA